MLTGDLGHRNCKRDSRRRVSDCETSRSQLRCWLRLARRTKGDRTAPHRKSDQRRDDRPEFAWFLAEFFITGSASHTRFWKVPEESRSREKNGNCRSFLPQPKAACGRTLPLLADALANKKRSVFDKIYRERIRRRVQTSRMLRPLAVIFIVISITAAFSATPLAQLDTSHRLIISIRDQKLMLLDNGRKVAIYPVSTSKYGVGDLPGRMTTPLGLLRVVKKIGNHAPVGAVFHNRQWTGEILQPNTPGRDPVTTRIIWLSGLEAQNAHAFNRCIYIHGTPEEKTIGHPASYGCVRMKARDIAMLYDEIPIGGLVQIIPDGLPKVPKGRPMPTTTALLMQNQKMTSQQ